MERVLVKIFQIFSYMSPLVVNPLQDAQFFEPTMRPSCLGTTRYLLRACPHASTACYNETGVQDGRRRNCAASNSWGSGGNPQPPGAFQRLLKWFSAPPLGHLGLGSVGTPRISIGPAGYRINRDSARRGWATETGHPNWGPRDPGQCIKTVMVVR